MNEINTKINLAPKQDFLEKTSTTSPIQAIAELIWNGLDAGANNIVVTFIQNGLTGIDAVVVNDDGEGINPERIKNFFGDLGESWKREASRYHGRALHGKKGIGRCKSFSIGNRVKWQTRWRKENGEIVSFDVIGIKVPFSFEYTTVVPSSTDRTTGTCVEISEISKNPKSLQTDKTNIEFAKIFAGYLLKNPTVKLIIDSIVINPNDFLEIVKKGNLTPISVNGKDYPVSFEIIEWKQEASRDLSLCDSSGIELHTIDNPIKTFGQNISIILKSDYFLELDKENKLLLVDGLEPTTSNCIQEAKNIAKAYVRERKALENKTRVEQWKAEKIYPYQEVSYISPIEIAERQVFDIIGVNIEDFLPSFDTADLKAKKFTFRLLAQAIKTNPESLQFIISEVLNLKKEQQEELAELLKRTPLTNVIKCAKTVSSRLDFLQGLQNLLFDKDTKSTLLERDQLHKILEHEAWIFDENFALAATEEPLEEVLKLHLDKLGKLSDDEAPVLREGKRQGRIDLLLSLAIRPRDNNMDYLVVELKRPSQKINSEVLSQIKSYAFAVSYDSRFDKDITRWKFIVVSNEMDEFARNDVNQSGRPNGQVYVDSKYPIEVWAFTWSEIISAARARLEFINKSLLLKVDREHATDYLIEAYEKYIPDSLKKDALQ